MRGWGGLVAVVVVVSTAGSPLLAQMLPAPEDAVAPVESGHRAAFDELIVTGYRPVTSVGGEVAIVHSGSPLRLPTAWTIDVQSGSGHGSAFTLLRFARDAEGVRLEEVSWRGRRRGLPPGRVRRAWLTGGECAPLVDAVRLLTTVVLSESGRSRVLPDGRLIGGGWMTSANFFTLVRVRSSEGATLLERRFCGYESSEQQLEYLPLEAVAGIARRILPEEERFVTLPVEEERGCHLASAFAQNLEAMTSSTDWWWVLDDSLEALGALGSLEVVPALEELRNRLPAQERTDVAGAKLERLLAAPEHWLQGAPKELSD